MVQYWTSIGIILSLPLQLFFKFFLSPSLFFFRPLNSVWTEHIFLLTAWGLSLTYFRHQLCTCEHSSSSSLCIVVLASHTNIHCSHNYFACVLCILWNSCIVFFILSLFFFLFCFLCHSYAFKTFSLPIVFILSFLCCWMKHDILIFLFYCVKNWKKRERKRWNCKNSHKIYQTHSNSQVLVFSADSIAHFLFGYQFTWCLC